MVVRIRQVSLLALVAGLLVIGRTLPLDDLLVALQAWIGERGALGPVLFGLVYVAATVLLAPCFLFGLAGGALFGPILGTITVSLASTTGAAAAFLIGRHLARRRVAGWVAGRPVLAAIDGAIGDGGGRLVALLRLSPLVPFNLLNYALGLSPVRFRPYLIATWLAMLPGNFLYVWLGHLAGTAILGNRRRTTAEWVALAVGLAATIAATVVLARLARSRLREAVDLASVDAGPTRPPSPVTTALLAAAAAVVSALAVATIVDPGLVGRRLGSPPDIVLGESYTETPDGPTFDHGQLDAVLAARVDAEGWVDYAGLAADPSALDRYIERVATAGFDDLGRSEKLALLINAYNAWTLRLILDHYPLDSIRDIPSDRRWSDVRWTLGGRKYSLDGLEHEAIRPHFIEPRIHFALVCAAVGCPPLRAEAYVAARLDEQLEEQARFVHGHETWFRRRGDEVHLTRLYQWYGGDFEQVAGHALDHAARYAPDLEVGERPAVRWLDYDWSLNDRANRRPR